jgi:hypothetical protein
MTETAAGEAQAGSNVFGLKIWKFFEHLLASEAVGQQIENIGHPNPHAPNARAPAALLRINGDSLVKGCHRSLSKRRADTDNMNRKRESIDKASAFREPRRSNRHGRAGQSHALPRETLGPLALTQADPRITVCYRMSMPTPMLLNRQRHLLSLLDALGGCVNSLGVRPARNRRGR